MAFLYLWFHLSENSFPAYADILVHFIHRRSDIRTVLAPVPLHHLFCNTQ